MIDPNKVMLMCRSRHGTNANGFTSGLVTSMGSGLINAFAFLEGCSDPALAANLVFHAFLQMRSHTHLLMVDDDIEFAARDVALMLGVPWREDLWGERPAPLPPDNATRDEQGDPLIVVGEYSSRTDAPKKWRRDLGFGFVLIARAALERMISATRSDSGAPLLGTFSHEDASTVYHFCPAGPNFEGHWVTEDHGFYYVGMLAGIVSRIERHVRLGHRGTKIYRLPPYSASSGDAAASSPSRFPDYPVSVGVNASD